jgi:hypothetical protein
VQPLLDEEVAELVLAAVAQKIVAVAQPVRDHVVMGYIVGNSVGSGAVLEDCRAALRGEGERGIF